MKTKINQMKFKKIKIFLADNHTIVRTCISHLMKHYRANIEVVGVASDGWHLLKLVASIEFDIVLIDAIMPGPSTLDIIKNMKIEFPKVSVLVSTSYSDMDFIIRCFKAGAKGYFLITGSIEHLIDLINKVHRGETVLPPEVSKKMAMNNIGHKSHIQLAHEILSDRELGVMCLMASGKGLSYVAEILSLSPKTVSSHRNNVMKKMGWQNNAEMMFYAIRKGLVKEEFPEKEQYLF